VNSIPGFASAQRQWENMEPDWADECICEPRYECPDCGSDHYKESDLDTPCTWEHCDGRGVTKIVTVEHGTPVAGCREHGWCTGCSSRNCEDCNG
jgi:hypothetical protein